MQNNFEINLEAEGFFQIRRFGPEGEMRGDRTVKNLILNNGLDLIGKDEDWMKNCYVGQSSQAVAASQTKLVDQIAVFSNASPDDTKSVDNSGNNPFIEISRTFTFDSFGTDVDIKEIGVGNGSEDLFSRTVIGTEKVRSDETLIVKYIHRWYVSSSHISQNSVDISGSSHTASIRVCNFKVDGDGVELPRGFGGSYADEIYVSGDSNPSDIKNAPTDHALKATSATVSGYSNGSHNRQITITWGSSLGNVSPSQGGLLRSVVIPKFGVFSYQIFFEPGIGKTDENSLTITFQVSWARRT